MAKDEVKCYGLHIMTDEWIKVMNKKFVDMEEKHRAVLVLATKDPIRHCASFVCPTVEERDAMMKELQTMGIKAEIEPLPAFVERKYTIEPWENGRFRNGKA